MQIPSRFWADLSTTDFQSLALDRAIAVLPVAATEQHGPHLPLSVDSDLANGVVSATGTNNPIGIALNTVADGAQVDVAMNR